MHQLTGETKVICLSAIFRQVGIGDSSFRKSKGKYAPELIRTLRRDVIIARETKMVGRCVAGI